MIICTHKFKQGTPAKLGSQTYYDKILRSKDVIKKGSGQMIKCTRKCKDKVKGKCDKRAYQDSYDAIFKSKDGIKQEEIDDLISISEDEMEVEEKDDEPFDWDAHKRFGR